MLRNQKFKGKLKLETARNATIVQQADNKVETMPLNQMSIGTL